MTAPAPGPAIPLRDSPPSCDLCGSAERSSLPGSDRIDGPLFECSQCGLRYVGGWTRGPAWAAPSEAETVRIVRETIERFPNLERSEEERLNVLNARWRLNLIRRYRGSGRLLEVGCGRGDFLKAAREWFEVSGVEPDPALAAVASREGPVFTGLIEESPRTEFDLAVSFHVIEHVESPTRFLRSVADRLKPGGLLVLETPDIGAWPYRLMRSRWRQFIPGHYYFFDHTTLPRLLAKCGFNLESLSSVGKYASPALVLTRLGRRLPFLLPLAAHAPKLAVPVNPGDIMLAVAVRK